MEKEIILDGGMDELEYHDGILTGTGSYQGELGIFLTEGMPETYTGETQVIPRARDDITLPTRKKVLEDDITVKKVPFYSTSNEAGGNTIYIAKE